jgi:lysophospholipase L1-like esterase
MRAKSARGAAALLWAIAVVAAAEPVAAPRAVGLVDNPCPPPLDKPAGVLRGYQLLIVPGALERSKFPPPDGPAEERYWTELEQLKGSDWPDLCHFPAENRADLAKGSIRAVFMGDSITEFWKMSSPDFFADGILDRGISGQTSGQIVLRFQADVIALHPTVVHVLAGTNDAASNTGPQRPIDLENNLRTMAELARVHGIAVILGTIPPAHYYFWQKDLDPRSRIAEVNAWIRDYARREHIALVDNHAALANPDGTFRNDLSNDGVHPNAHGYRAMERALAPMLSKALGRASPRRGR